MCGIAGVIIPTAQVKESMLKPMLDSLHHRGPDSSGCFTSGCFGLAHTRLSIIDLSGGIQPIVSEQGRKQIAVIANGEIYNYLELRAELEKAGRVFTTHSDSETILQSYALDPRNFINRLHGMYAFALFDSERQKLILARDRLGIKPLFYALLPDRLVFASELKAILPLLPTTPDINPAALSQFLHSRFTTGEETIFKGIRRVAPGEIVEIDSSLNIERRRYWNLPRTTPSHLGFDEALEVFDDLFEQVVKEHLRSDVPVGLFLSGGNDSAILLAMLKRLQAEPVRTFSVGYSNPGVKDELEDAGRMADLFGSQHTPIRLERSTFFRRIPQAVWSADELMRDAASLPTLALSEVAAQDLKVVFVGEGGDEAFGGYRRYRQNALVYMLNNYFAPGSGGFRTRSDWWRRQSQRVLGAELALRRNQFREPFISAWGESNETWSHLQRCQYTDIMTALPDNLLTKVDRMMMRFSLEGRVPFLDHRIIEFGLSLPDRLKVAGSQHKIFLRRWAERYLPKDHLYKKKRGFVVPVRNWLRGDFLTDVERKLSNSQAINEWFDTRQFPHLFQRQEKRGTASREIMCLIQFSIWHRMFIEQPGVVPTADEDPIDWMS